MKPRRKHASNDRGELRGRAIPSDSKFSIDRILSILLEEVKIEELTKQLARLFYCVFDTQGVATGTGGEEEGEFPRKSSRRQNPVFEKNEI